MSEFDFDRQDLRDGATYHELDYTDLDPRTHVRRLKREIEEIENGSGFKYTTGTGVDSVPSVVPENVGGGSGRIVGRIVARTSWQNFAGQQTEEDPSYVLVAILAVLGVTLALLGITMQEEARLGVLTLAFLLLLAAGLLYYFSSPTIHSTEYYYRKRTRILLNGEVGATEKEGLPTLRAEDVTVVYSGTLEIRREQDEQTTKLSRQDLPSAIENQLETKIQLITDEFELPAEPASEYRRQRPNAGS